MADGPLTRRWLVESDSTLTSHFERERVTGIEPAFSAWEADVLPLNYTRETGPIVAKPLVSATVALVARCRVGVNEAGVTLA